LSLYATATHGVLSGPAVERLNASEFKEIAVTNTILQPQERRIPKIKILSVAKLLGEAIKSIHEETSVSTLFVEIP